MMDSVDVLKKQSIPDVWQYYIKGEDERKAECSICHEEFDYKGDSTSILCEHLVTKHEIIVDTFKNIYFVEVKIEDKTEKKKYLSEDETKEEIDLEKEELQEDLTEHIKFSEFIHDRKGGSAVWQYFLVSEDKTYAKCKICLKVLKRYAGSTSGLKNHYLAKHHPKGKVIRKKMNPAEITFKDTEEASDDEQVTFRRYTSAVWKSFIRSDDKSHAKCKLCDKVIPCHKSSTSGLSSHLVRKHNISN